MVSFFSHSLSSSTEEDEATMFSFKPSPKKLKKKNVVPAGSEITFSNTSGSVFPVYAHEFLQIGAKWHQPPARPPRPHESLVQKKESSASGRTLQTLPAHPKVHLQQRQGHHTLPPSSREQRSNTAAFLPLNYNIHKELPPISRNNSHARSVSESVPPLEWDMSLSDGPATLRRAPAKREMQFQASRVRAGAARAHDRYNSIETSLHTPLPLNITKKKQEDPVPPRGNVSISQARMPVKVRIPDEPARTFGRSFAHSSKISPIDIPKAIGMSPTDTLSLSPDEVTRLSPNSTYTFEEANFDSIEFFMKSAPALIPKARPNVPSSRERLLPKAAPKPQAIRPPDIRDPLGRLRNMRLSAEAAKLEAERDNRLRGNEKETLLLSESRQRAVPRRLPEIPKPVLHQGTHAGTRVARLTPHGSREKAQKAQYVSDHRKPLA